MAAQIVNAVATLAVASSRVSQNRHASATRTPARASRSAVSCAGFTNGGPALRTASTRGWVKSSRMPVRATRRVTVMAASTTEELVVTTNRPLGMILSENAAGAVFVEELVSGGNAEASGSVKVGDILSACGSSEDKLAAATSFDATMDILGGDPDSTTMTLKLQRAVKAVKAAPPPPGTSVSIAIDGCDQVLTLEPDSVLRTALLDNDVKMYTAYGSMMNCGGGGQCGTCIVQVLDGMDQLSKKTDTELAKLSKKPDNYRLACQTVCEGRGTGTVKIACKPK